MNVMTVGIVVSTNRIDDILSPWTEILNKRGLEYNMNERTLNFNLLRIWELDLLLHFYCLVSTFDVLISF